MNPEQLWETTMNPETRRLLQVTVRTPSAPTRSSRSSWATRSSRAAMFIQDNALEVKNLDI